MTANYTQDELLNDPGTHQIGDNPLARKYRFSRFLILLLLIVNILLGFAESDQVAMFIARISIAFLLFAVGVRIYKKEILPIAYLNIYTIIMHCIYEGVVFVNAEYWQWASMSWIIIDAIINILMYKHIARCGIPYAVIVYFTILFMEIFCVMFIPQMLINGGVFDLFIYLIKFLPIIYVYFTWAMLRSDMMYKSESGFKLEMPKLHLSFRDVCITIISILLAGGLGWLALTYGNSIPSIPSIL